MIDLQNVNLAALVERDGVQLRGQHEQYGSCPKCGGSDRFHLRHYNGRDWFFCRQCHPERGDAIDYLKWQHGMTTAEACAALGVSGQRGSMPKPKPRPVTPAGIAIPDALLEPPADSWQRVAQAFVDECAATLWTPRAAKALDYLRRERMLSDDTIKSYGLGVNPKARQLAPDVWARRGYTIPHFYGGDLWRVRIRKFQADADPDKYKVVSGAGDGKTQLFNGDMLASNPHTVIIVGGEFDAMLAQQHAPDGVAIVTPGSETVKPHWEMEYLLRGRHVWIAFDTDEAGNAGAQAWAALGQRLQVPHGKDVTDYALAGGDVRTWLSEASAWDLDAVVGALQRLGYDAPRFDANGRIQADSERTEAINDGTSRHTISAEAARH